MGDGTSGGAQTPQQPGVIVREGENFPLIPDRFLKMSPDALQKLIERVVRQIEYNQESIIPNREHIEKLELTHVILMAAKVAVERQREAKERL